MISHKSENGAHMYASRTIFSRLSLIQLSMHLLQTRLTRLCRGASAVSKRTITAYMRQCPQAMLTRCKCSKFGGSSSSACSTCDYQSPARCLAVTSWSDEGSGDLLCESKGSNSAKPGRRLSELD